MPDSGSIPNKPPVLPERESKMTHACQFIMKSGISGKGYIKDKS